MQQAGQILPQVLTSTLDLKSEKIISPCGDCGTAVEAYWVDHPTVLGIGKGKWIEKHLCDECEEKQRQAYKIKLQEEKVVRDREALERAVKAARISPSFRERVFQNFEQTAKNEKAFKLAQDFEPNGHGLLFYGPTGTGKTHLMSAIGNKFLSRVGMLFISCPEFLDELRKNQNQKIDLLEIAENIPLLILDDIGAEKVSEWVQEQLFILINHRVEWKLSTLFTSNCSLSELKEKLGDRIASRIAGMCRLVRVDGEDHRVKVRKR